ncbi:MAG: LysM domain-containing protein [Candidatus Promineifilaceae bacterium]
MTHVVEAGDSLWSLAAIYNIGLDQLTVWNQLTAETVLRIGQELFIRQPPATATPEMVAVAAAPAAASPTPFATQPLIDVTTPPETLLPVAAATSTPIPEPLTADSALPDDLGTFLGIGILVIVGIVFLFLQRQQI